MEAHGMVGHLIRRLHQVETKIFIARARAAGFDITPVQFAAMDALHEQPDIDQATVAAMIDYDRATIGGVLDRLVAKGLVQRTVNQRDRRARAVRLTGEGESTFNALLPIVRSVQNEILRALDEEQQATFKELAGIAIARRDDPD